MAVVNDQQGTGSGTKWVFGCCGGCAGLVLLVVIVVGIIAYSLFKSRPVLPPETFLTAGADAFLIAQINPDDEALIELIQENARQQGNNVPKAQAISDILQRITPFHLVVIARHTEEEGEFSVGGVASIRPWSGVMRWFVNAGISTFQKEGGSTEDYERITIGTNRQGDSLAAVDNNFMFAKDKEMIKAWIDRIAKYEDLKEKAGEDEKPVLSYQGPAELVEMYGRLDREAQIRFVSSNEHGEIEAFLDWAEEQRESQDQPRAEDEQPGLLETLSDARIDWSGVAATGGTVRILDADVANIQLLFKCREEKFAKKLQEATREFLEEGAEEEDIEDIEVTLDGTLVKVQFKKSGVRKALQNASKPRQVGQPVPTEPTPEPEEAPVAE